MIVVAMAAFASSRVTVMATATPLVEVYYLAVITVVALVVTKRTLWLALLLPLLALTKETILPFLLLPLLTDLRRARAYWLAVPAAVRASAVSAQAIDARFATKGPSLVQNVREHLPEVANHLAALFSLRGQA
ncbi:MAG: hypothetical protein Q8O42_19100 [Acidobacteriota bacterium]|nr:hypothetical protein [Acidobacteriota bacterium]